MNPIYLAGLFDASGYLSIRKRLNKKSPYYALKCVISSADDMLLTTIQAQYGGNLYHPSRGYMLEWYSRDEIKTLLTDIQPHLITLSDVAAMWLVLLDGTIKPDELISRLESANRIGIVG